MSKSRFNTPSSCSLRLASCSTQELSPEPTSVSATSEDLEINVVSKPALLITAIMSSTLTTAFGSRSISALSVLKLTATAWTPSMRPTRRSTRATQEAQVIPPTPNTTCSPT